MESGSQPIGPMLREAREERAIELEDVERATKIRVRFLAAIEGERWEVLPGRAYATGFVRTYAQFLGLDPAPLVAELHRRLEPGEHGEEVPPEPIVQRGTLPTGLRRRIPLRLLAGVIGTAAVIALVAVALSGGDGDPGPEPASGPAPAEEESSDAHGTADPAGDDSDVETDELPAEPEPERAELNVEAAGTVWVCVVDGRGVALVDGETLAEGESRGPFEARRMLMTFGNGLVELTANGEGIDVPDAPSPLGYEVTATAVDELDPADRPTCG